MQRRETFEDTQTRTIRLSYINVTPSKDYKIKVIDESYSPVNGNLLVTTNPILGLNVINSLKIAISGDIMADIFFEALKEVLPYQQNFSRCLILGFGVGKTAKIIRKTYPNADITGIEIDPEMINLGIRYFGLTNSDAQIHIVDAYKGCLKLAKSRYKYELILVDVFIGDTVPERFVRDKFIKLLQKLSTDKGYIIFNRLYNSHHRVTTDKFRQKLMKTFQKVQALSYKNNLIISCHNNL